MARIVAARGPLCGYAASMPVRGIEPQQWLIRVEPRMAQEH